MDAEPISPRDLNWPRIPIGSIEQHLTRMRCEALMATPAGTEKTPPPAGVALGITTTDMEIENILEQIYTSTQFGVDGIPAHVLKNMNEGGIAWLTELINKIFRGVKPLPIDWRDEKVSIIEKAN